MERRGKGKNSDRKMEGGGTSKRRKTGKEIKVS